MMIFLSVLHYIICLILIIVILLQAGRGHGLAGFGGDSTQTVFGTKTSAFMTKATTIAAIGFLVTSLTMDIYTSVKSKSLLTDTKKDMKLTQEMLDKIKKMAAEKKVAVTPAGAAAETKAAANTTPETQAAASTAPAGE